MKNLILLGVIAVLLNCSMIEPDYKWYDCRIPTELKKLDPVLINERGVAFWVDDEVKYKLYANGFHSAQQTLNEMQGNCANKALVKIALWYQLTGQKGQLVYCWYTNGKVSGFHYAAKINGYIAEKEYITAVYEIISFDNIAEFIYYRQ
ncbi:MAG TPA: hypothetical protein VGB37_13940 [Candidatus Lokiarchaeia archaeon]